MYSQTDQDNAFSNDTVWDIRRGSGTSDSRVWSAHTQNNQTKDYLRYCMDDTDIYQFNGCRFIFDVYVVGILCLIGIVGNSLAIAVLRSDPNRQTVTTWLLQMLAIVDFIFLILSLITQTTTTIISSELTLDILRGNFRRFLFFVYPISPMAQLLTVWIVVLVTVDRYLAICKPMHVNWRRLRIMKTVVIVMVVLAILYNVPRFWELNLQYRWHNNSNHSETLVCLSDLWYNKYYQAIYLSGLSIIFRSIGPFIVLLLLNVRIIWELKALNKKRREMNLDVREERNITIMFVVVVVVFLVCQVPQAAIDAAHKSGAYFLLDVKWDLLFCASDIGDMLLVFNSSINFFIYCLIWKKFNKILVRMLQCKDVEKTDP